jgi:Transglycosylase-like domain
MLRSSVQPWFDNLQGSAPAGGGARPAQPVNTALAQALAGIIKPEMGGSPFQAPGLNPRFVPKPPDRSPELEKPGGIAPAGISMPGGGTPNLGGAAVAAGLGKLGQGIEKGLQTFAAKKAARDADLVNASMSPRAPLTPGATQPANRTPSGNGNISGNPGDTGVGASTAAFGSSSASPFTPSPIGAGGDLPTFAQPGNPYSDSPSSQPVPPIGQMADNPYLPGATRSMAIGARGGPLPTFAQGVPGAGGGAATGPSPGYLTRLAQIENPSGNPYDTSPTGATGKYQFTPSTWRDFGGGGDIHSNADQDAAIKRLNDNHFDGLQNALGRPPTDAEMYLAHQQGLGGAIKLLQNPNAPAGSVVSSQAIRVNAGNPNMSAGQFADKWANKWNQGAAPPSAPPLTGAAAYANTPPSSADTSPIPPAAPAQSSQSVTPGQSDPHKPGFDPSAVQFHQTPEMNQGAASVPIPPGPAAPPGPQGMNDGGAGLPGQAQSMLAQQPPIDPLALALAGGGDPGNPQMSPAIVAMLNAAAPAPEITMADLGGLGGLFG